MKAWDEVDAYAYAWIKLHAMYAASNAQARPWPYPHAIIEDVLPEQYYESVVLTLPQTSEYTTLGALGRVPPNAYKARHVITPEMLDGKHQSINWLFKLGLDREFCDALLRPFFPSLDVAERTGYSNYGIDNLLVRDLEGYKIGPHTDAPHRILSLLLYLPRQEFAPILKWGTRIYIPKDRGFRCKGGPHYEFDLFDEVAEVPFKPNTAVLFWRTDNSFHGVPPLKTWPGLEQRDVFLVNLRWPK